MKLVYNKSTKSFSECKVFSDYSLIKIGDKYKVLSDSSVVKLMRPWDKYNHGHGQKPDGPEPELILTGTKEKCLDKKNSLEGSDSNDLYGVIKNEDDFDKGGKSDKDTKSVGHKKEFKTKRDAVDYYDKKWNGQEYYLVMWDKNNWREIS